MINDLLTFVHKINLLNEFQRIQWNLPGPKRLKQIKSSWFIKIRMIEEAIVDCSNIDDKRRNAFIKAIKFVKDLEGPCMIRDSMIICKYIL